MKMFVVSCRTKSAIFNRLNCSFLILFNAPNASNLITVPRPDPYFSFLEVRRNCNLLSSYDNSATY